MAKFSPRLRLKDNHPTMVKLNKLCALAEELGISIHMAYGTVFVTDHDRDPKLPELVMEDIEEDHHIADFPPPTEYKVTYENPDYIAEQKREREEYVAKRKAEEEVLIAKKKEEEEAIKRKIAAENEARERKQLAELKAKYGE